MKSFWFIIMTVLLILGITAIIDLSLCLRLVAVILTLLAFLGIVMKLLNFKKPRKLRPGGLIFSIFLSLLVFVIYLFFLNVRLPLVLHLTGLLGGGWIGWLWGCTEKLVKETDGIKSQGNWLSLSVWALILLITQFVTLITGQVPLIMIVLLLLGTGISTGYSLKMMAGYRRLSRIH